MANPIDPNKLLDERYNANPSENVIDTRTFSQKFKYNLKNTDLFVIIGIFLSVIIFAIPSISEEMFVMGLLLLFVIKRMTFSLPLRLPYSYGGIDEKDIRPNGKPGTARGMFYFGNEIGTNKELWLAADDVKTHMLIFGTTGAGKALRNNEFILTSNGWKRNIDLSLSDYVQTHDGKLSKILGIYPQGEKDLALMKFSDGRMIKPTYDHMWTFYNPEKITTYNKFLDDSMGIYIKTDEAVGLMKKKNIKLALPYSVPLGHVDNFFDIHEFKNWVNKLFDLSNSGYSINPLLRASLLPSNIRSKIFDLINEKLSNQDVGYKHYGNLTSYRLPRLLARSFVFFTRTLGYWSAIESDSGDIEFDDHEDLHECLERINLNDIVDYDLNMTKEDCVHVTIKDNFPIVLLSVTNLKEKEEAQCIQIEDPNGLFMTRQNIVTHNTETLISITYNTLVQGSGFIYVDGKGDNGVWGKLMSCARQCGRDGEILVCNYMTGGSESFGLPSSKNSNTLNPLVTGTSATLVELVSSLMDGAGSDPMWKSRAVALLQGLMPPLVYMRNKGDIILDVDIIRNYMLIENVEKLSRRTDLPPSTLEGVKAYLDSLPGYDPTLDRQELDTLQQHGFLTMQFTRIFSLLADVYGFIFRTNLSEIVFYDVIVNRRILVVLLPALEKDPEGLSQLGKIILACLRQMMSLGLGTKLEGEHRVIIDNKPTAGPAPFLALCDEYGYYVTKGAAVMPLQLRSLGVGMVFAGQDYAAFKKNDNASEAQSTVSNCGTKVFMKIVESEDTYNLFKTLVGQATIAKKNGYEKEEGRLVSQKNISFDKVEKATLGDLSSQTEGFGHVIFKDQLVQSKMFFCNPPSLKEYRLNYFLRVDPLTRDDGNKFLEDLNQVRKFLLGESKLRNPVPKNIKSVIHILNKDTFELEDENISFEMGLKALIGFSLITSIQTGDIENQSENTLRKSRKMKDLELEKREKLYSIFKKNRDDSENPLFNQDKLDLNAEKRKALMKDSQKTSMQRRNLILDDDETNYDDYKDSEIVSENTKFSHIRHQKADQFSDFSDSDTEKDSSELPTITGFTLDSENETKNKSEHETLDLLNVFKTESKTSITKLEAISSLSRINQKIDKNKPKKEIEMHVQKTIDNLAQLTKYPKEPVKETDSKELKEILSIINGLSDEISTTSERTSV